MHLLVCSRGHAYSGTNRITRNTESMHRTAENIDEMIDRSRSVCREAEDSLVQSN